LVKLILTWKYLNVNAHLISLSQKRFLNNYQLFILLKADQPQSQSNRRRSKSFNAGNKRHDYYKQPIIRSNSTDNINKEQVKVVVVESQEETNNEDENKVPVVELKSPDPTTTKVKNTTSIKKIIIQDLNLKNFKLNGSKFKKSDSKPGLLFKRIINIIFSHKNSFSN